MRSKTISRLPGVASEGTAPLSSFLLVPNPVPEHGGLDLERAPGLSHSHINQLTSLCGTSFLGSSFLIHSGVLPHERYSRCTFKICVRLRRTVFRNR